MKNEGMINALKEKKPIDIKGIPSKHYVYKITCKWNKYFYIGFTNIPLRRLYTHNLNIIKSINGEVAKCLPFHEEMAKILSVQAKESGSVFLFIHSSFDIEILAIIQTSKIARVVEKQYLTECISDKYCLNWVIG